MRDIFGGGVRVREAQRGVGCVVRIRETKGVVGRGVVHVLLWVIEGSFGAHREGHRNGNQP